MRHAVFTTCCFCCTDGTQTSMPTVYFNKVRLSLIVLTLSASAERLPLFAYESFFWKPSPHEWTPLVTGDSSSTRRYRCTLCVGVSEPRFVVFFNMPSLNPAPSTWMSQVKFTGQALCTARKQEARSKNNSSLWILKNYYSPLSSQSESTCDQSSNANRKLNRTCLKRSA